MHSWSLEYWLRYLLYFIYYLKPLFSLNICENWQKYNRCNVDNFTYVWIANQPPNGRKKFYNLEGTLASSGQFVQKMFRLNQEWFSLEYPFQPTKSMQCTISLGPLKVSNSDLTAQLVSHFISVQIFAPHFIRIQIIQIDFEET